MLKKKKKVFENSSFSIKHSALSEIWTNPHLQKEIPLQSILGSPEKGKHFTIFLGEKELPEYFIGLMGKRKIQESLVSLVFKNQRDHMVHFFFFLSSLHFYFLYFMLICSDVWNQVIKHLTDNRIIFWCATLLLHRVSLRNYWFNRILSEDTITVDVTF